MGRNSETAQPMLQEMEKNSKMVTGIKNLAILIAIPALCRLILLPSSSFSFSSSSFLQWHLRHHWVLTLPPTYKKK